MGDLTAAHRGYEYQDLLEACRVVDLPLGGIVAVHVDEKLVKDDRFDDLTVIGADGCRERTQFKHSDNDDHPLPYSAFTSDSRGLRLDCLVKAAIADRDGPGASARTVQLRIVMRDAPPDDAVLSAVMVPARASDAPFLAGMNTTLRRFDAEALWQGVELPAQGRRKAGNVFRFLTEGKMAVSREDLDWLCEHLVVELGAPAMTMDLRRPGPAEELLLQRVRGELGAGIHPNEGRSPVDVAEAFIRTVRAARQREVGVTSQELLRRAQLRQDFGAVTRAHPVDRTLEVMRSGAVDALVEAAGAAAVDGGPLLVTGPPGQGKSWACQQLIEQLTRDGWLVAEHYCYLGDADGDQLTRVMTESVFGSLLGRLAEADPSLVHDQRPRFAADEEALANAVEAAIRKDPARRVALVVDGLDHVTRVRGGRTRRADPSLALAEVLSSLPLPPGSVLIVLSQPGAHLDPLTQVGAATVAVPPLAPEELRGVAARLGIVSLPGTDSADALLTDGRDVTEFLDALKERSRGNVLYATYLCREVALRPGAVTVAAATVRALPPYRDSLEDYYAHLHDSLGAEAHVVADIIALLGMAVTREELGQIVPDRRHRIDDALKVLAPVLSERTAQGEVRVYHESFARYLRLAYEDHPEALESTLALIATWLSEKGLFEDQRAFRQLLRILAEAGRDTEVLGFIERDFVVRAVSAAFPASAIRDNLATGLRCAARSGNWPLVVRCVELARAAEAYEYERFDSVLVDFVDVPVALLGGQTLADRLLHDGRTVMPARAGLQMCAALDAAGAVAPWHEYLMAFDHEAESDNTSYGVDADLAVELARLRGRLRLSATVQGTEDGQGRERFDAPVSLDHLAEWIDEHRDQSATDAVVRILLDTAGAGAVKELVPLLAGGGPACLSLAEQMAVGAVPGGLDSATHWARKAAASGYLAGTAHRLLALGVTAVDLAGEPLASTLPTGRNALLSLTRDVQQQHVRWRPEAVARWLDALAVAAGADPLGLGVAQARVQGPGWYPCWLRFAIDLVRAESAGADLRSCLAVEALGLLTGDLRPFAGDPRACDLYAIHPLIEETVHRAVALVSDDDWPKAWETLTRVSRGISTSLRGELGGPLPPDVLLSIAVEHATPARRASVEEAVQSEFEQQAGGRFYSDLATYLLTHARLALAAGDLAGVQARWLDACRFLVAYGWRKDITVYEVLDPLPVLATADPARGRLRVAQLQPLCERLTLHTDGKETFAARRQWWSTLAGADPVGLARLSAIGLLSDCNGPNDLLHGARDSLWHKWKDEADPVVATALRLTLDSPLLEGDAAVLDRLVRMSGSSVPDDVSLLLRCVLSRADERQERYGSSDSEERKASDGRRVAALNSVAERVGAPTVEPLPEPADEESERWEGASKQPQRHTARALPAGAVLPDVSPGPVGLIRALRDWRLRPYGIGTRQQDLDRMTNLVGYRLLGLAAEGRADEAVQVLRAITGPFDFGDGPLLLRQLAEGLERHGQSGMAAEAYALTWVRTRGHGGWLNFGGETALDALSRASQIDPDLTLRVVAEEAETIVSTGRYGSHGVTQALILAFARQAIGLPERSSLDLGFALWDEAAEIIEGRAPRVHDSDDPDHPYRAPSQDTGAAVHGDLDSAFAIAALAGMAHAGREAKRRSMIAVRTLIALRPEVAAPAMALVLEYAGDPATLMWLLCLLEEQGAAGRFLVDHCQHALAVLARGPLLTVRALARRLLADQENVPMGPSDPNLLSPQGGLWMASRQEGRGEEQMLRGLVGELAGVRLYEAEQLQPGLIQAVLADAGRRLDSARMKERIKTQGRAFRGAYEQLLPDAYLAPEEAVEEAIQRSAAGSRAQRLSAGLGVSDPREFEDQLATMLTDNPFVPLAFETVRWPRPGIQIPPGPNDQAGLVARATGETSSVRSLEQADVLSGQPLNGWYILGSVEKRGFLSQQSRTTDLVSLRFSGPEVMGSEQGNSDVPPFSDGDFGEWGEEPGPLLPGFSRTNFPLLGVDRDMEAARDAANGLGLPDLTLTPSWWLRSALHLRPAAPLTLADERGPALRLICWRTEYERSSYHLAWPRTTGCAVVIRPDLLKVLSERAPAPVVIRDFVMCMRPAEVER
ncbi:AAA family ATPase [Streptomyces hydrogenans]